MSTHTRTRADIRTTNDVARELVAHPPDIPGWDVVGKPSRYQDTSYLIVTYEDDEGALAFVTLAVTSVELDESRVPPEPREHEKGDTDQ